MSNLEKYYLPKISSSEKKNEQFPKASLSKLNSFHEELHKKINPAQQICHHRLKTISHDIGMKQIKRDVNQLKKSINRKRKKEEKVLEDKIDRVSSLISKSIFSQDHFEPRNCLIVQNDPKPLYPIIMPIPYYPTIDIPSPTFRYNQGYEKYHSNQYHLKKRGRKNFSSNKTIFHENSDDNDFSRLQFKKKKRPELNFRKKRASLLNRKWRIHVWKLIFALRLTKYSKKIMMSRKDQKNKFDKFGFNSQAQLFQKYVINKCRSFFVTLLNRQDIQLTISDAKGSKLQKQKAELLKKMIRMLINAIFTISHQDVYKETSINTKPIEFIHLFCKHGAFILNNFMTAEELEVAAISQVHGYLRMEKCMEKSQIINLIVIKILIFNAFLQPNKIHTKNIEFKQTIHDNLFFISSIFYEICMQLQDSLLCKAPIKNYDIGNWRKWAEKFDIKPAKSLIYKDRPYEKGQIISGLLRQKRIQKFFGKHYWDQQVGLLSSAIDHIHSELSCFHQELKNNILF